MRGRELKPETENLQQRERESEHIVYWTRLSVCVKLGDGERERERERISVCAYLPVPMVCALVYLSIRPCLQMKVHTKQLHGTLPASTSNINCDSQRQQMLCDKLQQTVCLWHSIRWSKLSLTQQHWCHFAQQTQWPGSCLN